MSVDSDLVNIMVKKFGYLEKRVTYLEEKCRGQQGLIEKLQKKVRKFRKENKSRVASQVLEGTVDLKPDVNSIQISKPNENLKESFERCARNDTKLSQKLIVQMGVRCEENHPLILNSNRAIDRKPEIISQSKTESPQQNVKTVKNSSKPKGSHVCSYCSKSCRDFSTLSIHMRVHTGERPFKCETCSKTFKRRETLKRHHLVHTGEKPYSCTFCSKSFTRANPLHDHIRSHIGERPYSCSVCSKTFSRYGSFIRHKRILTGVRCEENHPHKEIINRNRAIDQKSEIISQSKIEIPQQNPKIVKISSKPKASHNCSFCSKSFKNFSHLSTHFRVHTGERPFKCQICSKSFSRMDYLNKHSYTHTGEKPYSCSVCSKSFSQASSRNVHIRTHTGEKPHSCPICSKKFSQRSYLNSHRKKDINCARNEAQC